MTDKQLEYLTEIAAQGNVTRAAQKLFVGQSALSQVLAHVEAELGIQIFLRTPAALVPTAAGEIFLNAARQILEIKQSTMAQLSEKKGHHMGRIRVGMSQSRSWLFTPLIIPEFIRQYPDVNIEFIEGNEAELNQLLLNGKLDVMFTISPHTNSNFSYHLLFDEHIVLILAKDHPLAKVLHDPLDWAKLQDVPFILLCKDNNLRTISDQILTGGQISPRILMESRSMDVCFQMAADGLGATLVPDTLCNGHRYRDRVVLFPTGPQYNRKMEIVTRKNMYLPFVTQEFIRISTEKLSQAYIK